MKIDIRIGKLLELMRIPLMNAKKVEINPILSCIHIIFKKDYITCMSTNLEFDSVVNIKVDKETRVHESGEFVIEGKLLFKFLSTIKNKNNIINLSIIERKLILHSGKKDYEFHLKRVDDYPDIEYLENDNKFSIIDAKYFADGLQSSMYCSGKAGTEFDGVTIKSEDTFEMSSTNGHRLILTELSNDSGFKSKPMMIPVLAVKTLVNILNVYDNVYLYRKATKTLFLKFEKEDIEISLRITLNDVRNRDYKKLIPTDYKCIVHVNRKDLIGILDRSIIVFDSKKEEYFEIDISEEIKISTVNRMKGSAIEILNGEVVFNDIKFFKCKYTTGYFEDAVRNLKSDKITLKFQSDTHPALIHSFDDESELALVMPVKD